MDLGNAYFQKRARIDPESDCLIWLGTMAHCGKEVARPVMKIKKRTSYVARYTWQLFYGVALEPKDKIRNECGNNKCVNPTHYSSVNQYCPNGHLRKDTDTADILRCSVCRNEQSKRSQAKHH